MGGGCYKERACVESKVSHCHSAGDLVQRCPPNLSRISFTHRGNILPLPGPITPLNSLCTACLVSSSTALPLPASPQPGFSSFPVSVNSHFTPCPYHYPLPSSISLDLQISNPIPSGQTPNTPFSEPNRPRVRLPPFPRRQRSTPSDLRSRLNQALSHLFFLLPLPVPHEFPKTVPAPTPPS